jgi:hypothetical protein
LKILRPPDRPGDTAFIAKLVGAYEMQVAGGVADPRLCHRAFQRLRHHHDARRQARRSICGNRKPHHVMNGTAD